MHPLGTALLKAGISQQELSDMVEALKRERPNGEPLLLSQPTISQICSFNRRASVEVAEAISDALKKRGVVMSAADILFAKKPRRRAA